MRACTFTISAKFGVKFRLVLFVLFKFVIFEIFDEVVVFEVLAVIEVFEIFNCYFNAFVLFKEILDKFV